MKINLIYFYRQVTNVKNAAQSLENTFALFAIFMITIQVNSNFTVKIVEYAEQEVVKTFSIVKLVNAVSQWQ
jgi:hypothetical protein